MCMLGEDPIVGVRRRVESQVPMKSQFLSQRIRLRYQSPPTPLTVFIIYEDFGTGKRAKRAVEYVARESRDQFDISQSMWRLDILQNPELNFLAAPALAEADLLVISLRGDGQIPAAVRMQVDAWMAGRARLVCALVALFEAKASAPRSSVYACLTNLARRHGLDSFEQTVNEGQDQEEATLKLVWVF
jgi:hypothetical protein